MIQIMRRRAGDSFERQLHLSDTVYEMTKLTPLARTMVLLLLTAAGLAVCFHFLVPRKVRAGGC